MARTLILIRHAPLDPQHTGRFIGRTDHPLGPDGLRHAAALAAPIQRLGPITSFSSPALRAVQTADAAGLTPAILPGLREIDFGRWEGKTFDEIARTDPALVADWNRWTSGFAFPGGERIADFAERVTAAADTLAAHPADTVLAVTHGGVIRTIICHLLGLDLRNYLLFRVDPASITRIDLFGAKGILSLLNDQSHLKGT